MIDCRGQVVAPGFIDVHTHDDAIVLQQPQMLPKITQGVTTVIAGNCGISLLPLATDAPPPPLNLLGTKTFRYTRVADYRDRVRRARGRRSTSPRWSAIRRCASRRWTGSTVRPARDEQARMAALLDQA